MCRISSRFVVNPDYATHKLQLNDQFLIVLRVYLHILVTVWVHDNSRLPERVSEGVMRVAMNPQVGALVDDLVGDVGHESAVEAVNTTMDCTGQQEKKKP
jgi:hypothetical protein